MGRPVTVYGTIYQPDGSPSRHATVYFSLESTSVGIEGLVPGRTQEVAYTDWDGSIETNLTASQVGGTRYRVQVQHQEYSSDAFYIVIPPNTSSVALHTVIRERKPEVDDVERATQQAQEYSSRAHEHRTRALDARNRAEDARDNAQEYRDEAKDHRDEAENYAELAADHSRLEPGNVETLEPGQDATIDITGDPGEQKLHMGIPQGPRGEPGTQVSFELSGVVDTVDDLPNDPDNGEAWLVESTLYVYSTETEEWHEIADIGPQLGDQPYRKILHVSQHGGSDNNYGRSPTKALRTINKALELAAEEEPPVVIHVYPGDYEEPGEMVVPPNCTVSSVGGRYATNITIKPEDKNKNLFLVDHAAHVSGFAIWGQEVDDFEDPTGGFAIAFRPGAQIMRSPYAYDISQNSGAEKIMRIPAPPQPEEGNPLLPRGGGCMLADRSVISPFSTFFYMLAFAVTPRSPNGLGYVAKNGAGVNSISAITVFQHKSFYALNGGHITLNNSGTQFGDISMHAKGSIDVVQPHEPDFEWFRNESTAESIEDAREPLKDHVWEESKEAYPEYYEDADDETKEAHDRDIDLFIDALKNCFLAGTPRSMQSHTLGYVDWDGGWVVPEDMLESFGYAFEVARDYLKDEGYVEDEDDQAMLDALVETPVQTFAEPEKLEFGSLIESLGHQFNNAGSGVNKEALPLNMHRMGRTLPVPFTILEEDGGRVRWSGADEQANQYFAEGVRIDGRTGRFTGRPFNATVRQIARRVANARGG